MTASELPVAASTSTRAQAIDAGHLVDVTEAARALGIRCPVAISRAVVADCVPAGELPHHGEGRIHDILWMLRWSLLRTPPAERTLLFTVHVRNPSGPGAPRQVALRAIVGPDDSGEGCLTVLLR